MKTVILVLSMFLIELVLMFFTPLQSYRWTIGVWIILTIAGTLGVGYLLDRRWPDQWVAFTPKPAAEVAMKPEYTREDILSVVASHAGIMDKGRLEAARRRHRREREMIVAEGFSVSESGAPSKGATDGIARFALPARGFEFPFSDGRIVVAETIDDLDSRLARAVSGLEDAGLVTLSQMHLTEGPEQWLSEQLSGQLALIATFEDA